MRATVVWRRAAAVLAFALLAGVSADAARPARSRATPFPRAQAGALGLSVTWIQVLSPNALARDLAHRPAQDRTAQTSPDGTAEIFVRFTSCGQAASCSFLWLRRQGVPPALLHRAAHWMQWSRQGTRFAFVGLRDPLRPYPKSLYIYDYSPLRLRRRLDVDPHDYAWNPAGDAIVVTGVRHDAGERAPVSILIADPDGRGTREVDHVPWRPDPTRRGAIWAPDVPGVSWSPDGRYLVYSYVQRAAAGGPLLAADLVVAHRDGLRRQMLTRTPLVTETWPRWVARDQILTLEVAYTESVVLNLVVPPD